MQFDTNDFVNYSKELTLSRMNWLPLYVGDGVHQGGQKTVSWTGMQWYFAV